MNRTKFYLKNKSSTMQYAMEEKKEPSEQHCPLIFVFVSVSQQGFTLGFTVGYTMGFTMG